MKFAPALLLPATALALSPGLSTRQTDINTVTDQYLFGISLLQFEIYHNYQIPNTVSWVTDGCTNAPNNPFGFDYVSTTTTYVDLLLHSGLVFFCTKK